MSGWTNHSRRRWHLRKTCAEGSHDLPTPMTLETARAEGLALCGLCCKSLTAAPSAPSPLAVPDTVRRLVWQLADALGSPITAVVEANDTVWVNLASGECFSFPVTGDWVTFYDEDGDIMCPTLTEPLAPALTHAVSEWASGLVAQAVTDGDWGRP